MKKLFGLVAFGIVAFFGALPTPAVAGFFDRPNYDGVRFQDRIIVRIMARNRGIDPEYTYPGIFRGGWGGRYYDSGDYYYPNPTYYPNAGTYYSAYPQEPAVEVNAVMIRMHVPSSAQVWIEGEATAPSGADRAFVSPALTPGLEYEYHIRVQWNENNKVVDRKRNVTVHAGDRLNLHFGN